MNTRRNATHSAIRVPSPLQRPSFGLPSWFPATDYNWLLHNANSIRDKSILITGAGRGIGKRLALGFAAAGARVGLLARSQAELDLAKLEIEQAGGVALRLRADVRELKELTTAVDRMLAEFERLDVLIAAAAIQGPVGPLLTTKAKPWLETIETNLIGTVNSCRASLPAMIHRRSGKIILVVGGGSGHARPNFGAYAASKAAVVRFAECLAVEVRDHNVQVNCISPGSVYSHMTDEILQAGEERAGRREIEEAEQVRVTGGIPPEKQFQLALFLASERSNHISGKLIHVNDDWKRFEQENMKPELFTLRRVQKI
jgi:NAD(P)-dependent dehydrogenase (short-subunit alcohol dehydrogenase family)